ncbi:hypothetical protein [Sporomusa sphaeroides]|uniref:Fimbrial assembly protein PilN n=1 Tax=Sporomusa sphaeroides DSM 2875 TaxID=1337886 RepID=A0A1U7MA40_9FIRM|nr:hypothetical protein [Sporomusa sphaeroides]OLS54295.1 hypothetical protein SPSPH_45410 [Sporomusa sphaeroides DSM 2875]CVK21675.1 hypothetical protein SSPH_04370 [Sporomusa sphaeroides DSM 2875]
MKRYAAVNLLGSDAIKQIEYERNRDKIFYILLAITAMLVIFLAIEIGFYSYYAMYPKETPVALKTQYQEAITKQAEIHIKVQKIAKAEKEKKDITDTIDQLLIVKPEDIKFTSLIINDNKVNIECFSKNPKIFYEFTNKINLHGSFQQGQVEKVTSVKNNSSFNIKEASIRANVQ